MWKYPSLLSAVSLLLSVSYEMLCSLVSQSSISLHSADKTVCMWVSPFMFPAFSIPFTCKGDGEARREKKLTGRCCICFQRLKNCCIKWESEKSSYLRKTNFLSVCKCVLDNVSKSERLCIRCFRSWHAPSHTHTHWHAAVWYCSGQTGKGWWYRSDLILYTGTTVLFITHSCT